MTTGQYDVGAGARRGPREGSSAAGAAQSVKEQAAAVGSTARQAAGQVAATAGERAAGVVGEAKAQARDLLGEARGQLTEQVGGQQDRLASGLRSLGAELREMAERSDQGGLGAELARQASRRTEDLAEFLRQRDPGALVEELRDFARRRPGAFLLGAALAGVVAGRLTRGAVASQSGDERPPSTERAATGESLGAYGAAGLPATPYPPVETTYPPVEAPGMPGAVTPATDPFAPTPPVTGAPGGTVGHV